MSRNIYAFITFSHLDHTTSQGFSTSGYFCPQCKSKYCELPVECKACGKICAYSQKWPLVQFHWSFLFKTNFYYRFDVSLSSSFSKILPSFISFTYIHRRTKGPHTFRTQVSKAWTDWLFSMIWCIKLNKHSLWRNSRYIKVCKSQNDILGFVLDVRSSCWNPR